MGRKKDDNQEVKEYGVVLKKNKKYWNKIFPQNGKISD